MGCFSRSLFVLIAVCIQSPRVPKPRGSRFLLLLASSTSHQNGECRGVVCTVIQRSSVNSLIPALPPKRPMPEPFTPPKGICVSSCTVGPFTRHTKSKNRNWPRQRRQSGKALAAGDCQWPHLASSGLRQCGLWRIEQNLNLSSDQIDHGRCV